MSATIRRMEPADRDAALRLLSVQLIEHGVEIDDRLLGSAIDGVLERPERGFFLVAAEGDALVGIAYVSFHWTLEHGGPAAWLEELYVVPERREQGLGTELLHAALDRLRSCGCLAVDLEIERGHERVASLYSRTGFTAHTRSRWWKKLTS